MAIRVKLFPEYKVSLHVYSGAITVEEVRKAVSELDPASRWLSYYTPTVDLSAIDVAHIPELRGIVSNKEQARGGARLPTAIVTTSDSTAEMLRFWCSYAVAAPSPHEPAIFDSLEEACRWLGLPPDAHGKIAAEISPSE